MDLSKAFDNIQHDILIAKLHAYGFGIKALKLIYSYLINRTQTVKVKCSARRQVRAGVPQGSLLRVLLFNVYLNDIFDSVRADLYSCAENFHLMFLSANKKDLINQQTINIKGISLKVKQILHC